MADVRRVAGGLDLAVGGRLGATRGCAERDLRARLGEVGVAARADVAPSPCRGRSATAA